MGQRDKHYVMWPTLGSFVGLRADTLLDSTNGASRGAGRGYNGFETCTVDVLWSVVGAHDVR
jgi:hypothetical protein